MTKDQLDGWIELFLMRFGAEELRTDLVQFATGKLTRAGKNLDFVLTNIQFGISVGPGALESALRSVELARQEFADAIEHAARLAERRRMDALPVSEAYEIDERGWMQPTTFTGHQRRVARVEGDVRYPTEVAHRMGLPHLLEWVYLYLPNGERFTEEHARWIQHAYRRRS